jgi:hypothetical protein
MFLRMSIPTTVLLLAACSGYAPPANLDGLDRGSIIARMGPPDLQRPVDGGTRLEFSRGPYGHHTWFVDLDSAGKVVRAQQVLTEQNFLRIVPGMAQEAVRDQLGRPSERRVLGRARGVVWNYRYENPFCLWFQVEIAADGKVRSSGHGTPPECEREPPILRP